MGGAFVAELLHEHQRVHDLPAAKRVHDDVNLVLGGHLSGRAVPLQHLVGKAVHGLDERHFEVQAGFGHRLSHDLLELGDDNLLAHVHGVTRGVEQNQPDDDGQDGENGGDRFHRVALGWGFCGSFFCCICSMGRNWGAFSSRMILLGSSVSSSPIVSR